MEYLPGAYEIPSGETSLMYRRSPRPLHDHPVQIVLPTFYFACFLDRLRGRAQPAQTANTGEFWHHRLTLLPLAGVVATAAGACSCRPLLEPVLLPAQTFQHSPACCAIPAQHG